MLCKNLKGASTTTRPIRLIDIASKLEDYVPRNILNIAGSELKIIFMVNPGLPIINSDRTFNEKIQDLCDFRILKLVSRNGSRRIYSIDWDQFDKIHSQLKESQGDMEE